MYKSALCAQHLIFTCLELVKVGVFLLAVACLRVPRPSKISFQLPTSHMVTNSVSVHATRDLRCIT